MIAKGTLIGERKEASIIEEKRVGPPLDFSFKEIKAIEDLIRESPRSGKRKPPPREVEEDDGKKTEGVIPNLGFGGEKQTEKVESDQKVQKQEMAKPPKQPAIYNILPVANVPLSQSKTVGRKFQEQKQTDVKKKVIKLECNSLILNNNEIRSLAGFDNVLEKVMFDWTNLTWLDLAHNLLTKVDFEFSEHFPQLSTIYLHVNYFNSFKDIRRLSNLQSLKTVTLHGNPIEQVPGYRLFVIGMLPYLKRLDSVLITKKERDNSLVWNQGMNLQKIVFKKKPEHPKYPPAILDDNPDKELKPKEK